MLDKNSRITYKERYPIWYWAWGNTLSPYELLCCEQSE